MDIPEIRYSEKEEDILLLLKQQTFTGLSKIGLLLVTKSGDRYFATQRKEVIELFSTNPAPSFTNIEEGNLFTFFDLINDEVKELSIHNLAYTEYICVPVEIAPPLYLNPDFEGVITNEQLLELQTPYLLKIKNMKDRGCFTKNFIYSEDEAIYVKYISHVIKHELNIDYEKYPELQSYCDPVLGDFTYYFNTKDDQLLRSIYDDIPYVLPTIVAKKYNVSEPGAYLDIIRSKELFNDVKGYWIPYLKEKQQEFHTRLQEEANDQHLQYCNTFLQELKEEIIPTYLNVQDSETLTKIADRVPGFLAAFFFRASKGEISLAENFDELILSILDVLQINTTEVSDEVVESLSKFKDYLLDELSTQQEINSQYNKTLQEISSLDFEKELESFDEYKICLRYWPTCFPQKENFHRFLRPLTTRELSMLAYLKQEGIQIDVNFNTREDYNNSLVDRLNVYCQQMREKRLAQIISVTKDRVAEIENEIKDISDTLTEDERKAFDEVIADTLNVEKYKQELDSETEIFKVMQYWPVELYPKPANLFVFV